VNIDILVLFQILEEILQTLWSISCWLVIYSLYYIEVHFSYIEFVQSFYHERCWILLNAKPYISCYRSTPPQHSAQYCRSPTSTEHFYSLDMFRFHQLVIQITSDKYEYLLPITVILLHYKSLPWHQKNCEGPPRGIINH
jgi:hypothetical protein